MTYLIFHWLFSFCPKAEMVCRVSILSTFCASLTKTGLQSVFSEDTEGNWTVFAPTNTAFFNLGDSLTGIYNSTDELTDLLLYHAFDGVLYVNHLLCGSLLQMANGQTSSTECEGESIYQVGGGNSPDAMPQLIAKNINVCNGVLHFINEVMLPTSLIPLTQAAPECKTIGTSVCVNKERSPPKTRHIFSPIQLLAELVCDSRMFDILCAALQQTGLDSILAEAETSWTMFSPTNEAFAILGDDALGGLTSDTDLLITVLLSHVAAQAVPASDLECDGILAMTSGTNTTTLCRGNLLFQRGDANEEGSFPQIILPDISACNGILHVVNQVLLPDLEIPDATEEEENEDDNIRQEEDCQFLGTFLTHRGFLVSLLLIDYSKSYCKQPIWLVIWKICRTFVHY